MHTGSLPPRAYTFRTARRCTAVSFAREDTHTYLQQQTEASTPIPETSQPSASYQTDSPPAGTDAPASRNALANETRSAATASTAFPWTEPTVSVGSDAPSDTPVAGGSVSSLTNASSLTPTSSHSKPAAVNGTPASTTDCYTTGDASSVSPSDASAVPCNSTASSRASHSVLLLVGCSDGSLRSFSLGAGAEGGQLKMFRKKKPLPEISAAVVLGRLDGLVSWGEHCKHEVRLHPLDGKS